MRSLFISILTIAFVPALLAQGPSKRFVTVAVTEPQGRAVTGLEANVFHVTENGVNCRILRIVEVTNDVQEASSGPRNQYRIEFESLTPSAVSVNLDQPRGMPKLQVRIR